MEGTAEGMAEGMDDVMGEQVDVNISEPERLASLLGGGALALFGLSRRSLGGLVLAALGGALIYRGVTQHCHVFEALGINTANVEEDEELESYDDYDDDYNGDF